MKVDYVFARFLSLKVMFLEFLCLFLGVDFDFKGDFSDILFFLRPKTEVESTKTIFLTKNDSFF